MGNVTAMQRSNTAMQRHQPNGWAINPTSLKEALECARMLADSGMVPKQYIGRPGAILVAGQMGADLGMSITQAMKYIAVINGTPCLFGDGPLGVCMKHPSFVDCVAEVDEETGTAVCTVYRKGRKPTIRKYTVKMAKTAGLWGKAGPWTTAPDRMLMLRARAFALRDSFPDALMGVGIQEEVEEYAIDGSTGERVERPKEYIDVEYTEDDKAVLSAAKADSEGEGKPDESVVDYDAVVAAIEAADSPAALREAGIMVRQLTGEERSRAVALGVEKQAELDALESAKQSAVAAEAAAAELDEE